jgi:hypothetical protein
LGGILLAIVAVEIIWRRLTQLFIGDTRVSAS